MHPLFIVMVIRAKYVLFTHHCERSFVFKVIVVTVVASSYSVRITCKDDSEVHISMKQ